MLIAGEPGIGKTRIVDELMAESQRRGIMALLGRCSESEGSLPYLPFVEILEAVIHSLPPEALWRALGDEAAEVARLVPEIRGLFPKVPGPLELPLQQQRRNLFNSVGSVLERVGGGRALLLVIEDLHGADVPTLLLLEHLADRLPVLPALIVGTYRDVELARCRPLEQTIRKLRRRNRAGRVHLRRLPPSGVRALIEGLTRRQPPDTLVQAIFDETEGNPFFVEEVVRNLAEEGVLFDADGSWRGASRWATSRFRRTSVWR